MKNLVPGFTSIQMGWVRSKQQKMIDFLHFDE